MSSGPPVAVTLNRGTDFFYRGIGPWDQSFFYSQGLHCLTHDVPAQIGDAFRTLADLTATSIPWPQVNEIGLSRIADITNILYCSALIIAILVLIRRRRSLGTDRSATASTGMTSRTAKILLWQLATVVPVVIVYGSEPRYRIPYDALGLILIAALVARRSDQVGKPGPSPQDPDDGPLVWATNDSRMNNCGFEGTRSPGNARDLHRPSPAVIRL